MNIKKMKTPTAIIVAGVIIAGAVIFTGSVGTSAKKDAGQALFATQNIDTTRDHILGSSKAKVTIIEYSDFECPFCARFHPTVERIVEEYDGDVAWVYRHFPLTSIHSRATGAAIASECAAELGGNDAFWDFSAQLFYSQRILGEELYIRTAVGLGIPQDEFAACLVSNKFDDHIEEDLNSAVASGGRGTPFSVIISESGKATSFSGALPYEQVQALVESVLEG